MYFPLASDRMNRALAPITDAEVSEGAQAAIDHIKARGWCQHRLRSLDGKVCLQGAIYYGLNALDNPTDADCLGMAPRRSLQAGATAFAVSAFLFPEHTGDWLPTPDWNDERDRTEQDVIDILDEVRIKYAPDAMHGVAGA